MRSLCAGGVAAAALVSLAACSVPQSQPPQDMSSQSVPGVVPAQSAVVVPAYTPPLQVVTSPPAQPVAQAEAIPPSPGGGAMWQPGHWQWTGIAGSPWQWVAGEYVVPPTTVSQWMPGHWENRFGQGWVWVDGHWT
jgi:hypothetical protein